MKKELKHPPYYAIDAFEILARKTSEECANALGISPRTYYNKKIGLSDFTQTEGDSLAKILAVERNALFLT